MNIPAKLQRRPFFAPIGLLAMTAMVGVVILLVVAWLLITSTSTTVIVVRHAPQVLGEAGAEAPLTPEGQARAALLAQLLGDTRLRSRVEAIYVSATLRSRSTAAPLAKSLGITPEIVPREDVRSLVRDILRDHTGATVLVVGHADTLPAIVSALSGEKDIPPVASGDYSTMYIVTVPRIGRASILRLNY